MILPGWGEEGQRRIAAARVAVIGVGGLGSPVALYLAASGVGHLTLVDADTVSLSNLQRQILHGEESVGESKTLSAMARIREINAAIEIALHDTRLTPHNAKAILADHDIIIDCTDNYAARYLIDDVAREMGIPWIYGAVGGWQGAVALFGGKHGKRFRDLYPEADALQEVTAGDGAIAGPVPGVIGSMQALEALKYIVGIDSPADGALFTINLTTYDTYLLEI